MMRQIGKQILTIALLLAGLAGGAAPVQAAALGTLIVADPLSGIAIDGWDPVSYFTESEPQRGVPDFEYVWNGAPWFFISAANRDAFKLHPEVYAPQFGGHCGMSVARGYLSDGNPRVYVLRQNRLYFFFSMGNRDAFMLSPDKAVTDADGQWAYLSQQLSTR